MYTQHKPTLEERIKSLENWADSMAMTGNYNVSRIHKLEEIVYTLKQEIEELKKKEL
jgi:hypothetical protein